MMKTIFHSVAFCLWLSLGVHAQAAEQEITEDQQEQPEPDVENEDQVDVPEAMPDIGLIEEENIIVEDDENFVPSIRITEDLPVAFPVDI